MHASALIIGRLFLQVYAQEPPLRILDIGSRDVNGSLRPYVPPGSEYVGIDLEPGPGVDMVLRDPYSYPFEDRSFDVILSTSAFEHDKLFWLTFLQCCRVLNEDGLMYVNVPSNGSYHGYPHDYWRFYPDSGMALQEWGQRMLQPINLVESFVAPQINSEWNDYVMIFARNPAFRPPHYLSDRIEFAHNIRQGTGEVRNLRMQTQDQVKAAQYRQQLERLTVNR